MQRSFSNRIRAIIHRYDCDGCVGESQEFSARGGAYDEVVFSAVLLPVAIPQLFSAGNCCDSQVYMAAVVIATTCTVLAATPQHVENADKESSYSLLGSLF